VLRAPTQVPWRCSARAMANFHCEVAAYHPLPKTPCAAIGRCASRWSYVSLGGPPERLGHLRFVPGGLERDNRIFGPATESPPAVFGPDSVPRGPMPAWAPRRARRSPDIHSGLVGAVFVRIWAQSCIVRTGIQEG
jgi:hypothetical protein